MSEPVPFKRSIGLFMAVMIGIGAMMGPGIFALPGPLASLTGPLGVLAYLLLGLVVLPTALNYGELGAALPVAGGGYSFVSRTMPKTLAFATGWFFWIGNVLAASMYALIFALTVKDYLLPDISVPAASVAVTLVFLVSNLRGTSQSLKLIAAMNLVELAVLVGFAVLGAAAVDPPTNLTPIAPHGWGALLPGMALIYVSFVGFDLVTVAAEEIIRPGRTIPRAILITLGVGIVLYVVVVGVMMGAVHHTELADSDVPFILAADRMFGSWGRWAGVLATAMASLSAFSVTLGASARILFALGRDGHMPRVLTRLHRRFQTPHVSLMVCALVISVFASSGFVALVASVAAFGYLAGQGIVNLSVLTLEQEMPALRRPFRVWGFPWMPLVGVLTPWAFIPALEPRAFFLGAVLTAIGGGIYLTVPANRAEVTKVPAAMRSLITWMVRRRKSPMRVLIISGGQLGQSIAERLLAKDEYRAAFRSHEHQITFVEPNEDLCAHLEAKFGAPIFQGDGTKREVLEQVGVGNVDVAVAAAEDDGANFIAALQARRLGMPKVIAIVQDPERIPLLESHGVVGISAPWTTAGLVESHLDRPGVAELFEIESGTAHLIGVIVPEGSRVLGRPIRELPIPAETVVAAVIRDHVFVVPRGDTVFDEGDHVVFVGPAGSVQEARDMFLAVARG